MNTSSCEFTGVRVCEIFVSRREARRAQSQNRQNMRKINDENSMSADCSRSDFLKWNLSAQFTL